jgi:hypothetical protein
MYLFSGAADAADFSSKLFGHDVLVYHSKDILQQQLMIDGKLVVKESIVAIVDIRLVDGTGVAIGYTSAGGNACDASYFVLAFPKDQPVRIDGPIGNCFAVKYAEQQEIKFSTAASVTHIGETWTLADGMSQKRQ